MNKVQKIAGILSSQEILELINKNIISSDQDIDKDIIQPASIDLRLGIKAWRVPASFLPGKGNKVSSRLKCPSDCLLLCSVIIELIASLICPSDCLPLCSVITELIL